MSPIINRTVRYLLAQLLFLLYLLVSEWWFGGFESTGILSLQCFFFFFFFFCAIISGGNDLLKYPQSWEYFNFSFGQVLMKYGSSEWQSKMLQKGFKWLHSSSWKPDNFSLQAFLLYRFNESKFQTLLLICLCCHSFSVKWIRFTIQSWNLDKWSQLDVL